MSLEKVFNRRGSFFDRVYFLILFKILVILDLKEIF